MSGGHPANRATWSHPPDRPPGRFSRRLTGWERILLVLFVWIALEDTFRKFLGNPLAFYLVKDFLVAYICVSSLWRMQPPASVRWIPGPLLKVLVWGLLLFVLGAFNPRLGGPLVSLNGIRLTFLYVPMFLVGFRLAAHGWAIPVLLRTLLLVGCVVAAVGLYQALIDPAFLTPEPSEALAGFQLGMVRGPDVQYVVSTFLSPARYVFFLLDAFAAGVCLFLGEARAEARAAVLGGVGLISLALVTSGSRTAVVALGLFIGGGWLFTLRLGGAVARRPLEATRRQRIRRALFLAFFGASILGAGLLLSEKLQTILRFYWETLLSPEGEGVGARSQVTLGFESFDATTWLVGNGTGSASFGLQYILDDFQPRTEGGYSSLIWEHGILGLAFYLALAYQLSQVFLRPSRGPHAPWSMPVAASFGPLVMLNLWLLNVLGPVLQQYVVSIFLWFFSGLAFGLKAPLTHPRDVE